MDFPPELCDDLRFPMINIKAYGKKSYPSWADFSELFPEEEDDERYFDSCKELVGNDFDDYSQLLGWPDVIQDTMFEECALVTKGYYLGNPAGWKKIPDYVRANAAKTARDTWLLLFQLDTVKCDDFELMFGDCGHIYFFITKEDLATCKFDRIWMILQCY